MADGKPGLLRRWFWAPAKEQENWLHTLLRVLGNILRSSVTLIVIGIGALFAGTGYTDYLDNIEQRNHPANFFQANIAVTSDNACPNEKPWRIELVNNSSAAFTDGAFELTARRKGTTNDYLRITDDRYTSRKPILQIKRIIPPQYSYVLCTDEFTRPFVVALRREGDDRKVRDYILELDSNDRYGRSSINFQDLPVEMLQEALSSNHDGDLFPIGRELVTEKSIEIPSTGELTFRQSKHGIQYGVPEAWLEIDSIEFDEKSKDLAKQLPANFLDLADGTAVEFSTGVIVDSVIEAVLTMRVTELNPEEQFSQSDLKEMTASDLNLFLEDLKETGRSLELGGIPGLKNITFKSASIYNAQHLNCFEMTFDAERTDDRAVKYTNWNCPLGSLNVSLGSHILKEEEPAHAPTVESVLNSLNMLAQ